MPTVYCAVCDQTIEQPPDGICPDCGVALNAVPAAASPIGVAAPPVETCPVCDSPVSPGATVCDSCGVNLVEARALLAGAQGNGAAVGPSVRQADTCPSCGAPKRPGAQFCRECGEPFPKEAKRDELLTPGEFLSGRYRVERKLGGGGMGAVYLAQDLNLKGKPVAIKAVLNSDDPDLLNAARQEVENLLGIDHPNIVTLRDIVEKGRIPFIVMDYLEGPDWNDLYEQRVAEKGEAFTSEEALQMILGVLPAFEYLHSRKPPVVYRDFKPGQVKLVQEKGTGVERHVLLDLGVAYGYEGVPVEAWGTAGYAPPEIGGVSLQPPTMDLATICRTLQGLLGIDLMKYGYGNMPPMESVPWIPEELYYLLERGTALDPRRRFQTLADLRAQLEGVLRLIQGREGRLPRPVGDFHMPVVSRLFTGHLSRTTGHLLALPVPTEDDPAAPTVRQAGELLVQGKVEEALQQAEAALRVNARSTSARLLKSVALGQMGQLEQAQSELKALEQVTDPQSDSSFVMVAAQIAEQAGDLQAAERLYRDLIRLEPGELPPRQKLANLLLREERYVEAAQLYAQIVGADPANAEAILNWADALAAIGRSEESIDVLRRVGENAVRFVDAQTRMIELLLQRAGQDPDALNLAAEAIDSLRGRTQTPLYYRLLGDWWFEAYQKGRRNQLDGIKQWPLVGQAQNMAQIAAHARDAYRHYLRVAPNNPDADEVIGRIHFGIRHLM
ncbi:MAG: zinc ribbon domain-containing protein [Chloroflexota bacterium]|nr:zinc ribbon domain-containing protein [Chloroflexota bacterium]